jgi:hypothetical protein
LIKTDDPGGIPYGIADPVTGHIRAWVTLSLYGKASALPYYLFKKPLKCLPIFNVGKSCVSVLDQAVKSRIPLHVKSSVEFVPDCPTANVIASLPGETNEEILFLAHLDTVYCSPGANDNTASVLAMLMVMHHFSRWPLRRPMTFVATTGEEYNKLGARHYALRRRNEGTYDQISHVINLDSVTWGPNMKIFTQDNDSWDLIEQIDEKLGIPGTPLRRDQDGFMLDALPFRETGAKAVYVNSSGYDLYDLWHRPEDTPDKVPTDCVEIFFRLFAEYIARLQSRNSFRIDRSADAS